MKSCKHVFYRNNVFRDIDSCSTRMRTLIQQATWILIINDDHIRRLELDILSRELDRAYIT